MLAQLFLLCAKYYSTECSRTLLCCRQESIRLLWFGGVFFCVFFSTLCLQVGNRLGFWGGFSCFVSFIWCQLFACLIKAAIFRFSATSICGLVFLSLPQAFVVCSFFLCHRQLWSVLFFFVTGICVQSRSFTAFFAIGIRVRLFVFTLLALVSGYQCISQFLVPCCALAAHLEI